MTTPFYTIDCVVEAVCNIFDVAYGDFFGDKKQKLAVQARDVVIGASEIIPNITGVEIARSIGIQPQSITLARKRVYKKIKDGGTIVVSGRETNYVNLIHKVRILAAEIAHEAGILKAQREAPSATDRVACIIEVVCKLFRVEEGDVKKEHPTRRAMLAKKIISFVAMRQPGVDRATVSAALGSDGRCGKDAVSRRASEVRLMIAGGCQMPVIDSCTPDKTYEAIVVDVEALVRDAMLWAGKPTKQVGRPSAVCYSIDVSEMVANQSGSANLVQ